MASVTQNTPIEKNDQITAFIFELFTFYVIIGIPFHTKYHGFYGWCYITCMAIVSVWLDYYLFSYMKKNLLVLKQHGYSPLCVWSTMLFNLLSSSLLVGAIYYYTEIHDEMSVWVLLKVITNLIITEVLFTLSHMCLHYTEKGARLHLMHHCCRHASWSTNLIFHPVDIGIEFSGPVLSVLAMHYFVWNDGLTLFMTACVVHTWYGLDHSALLKLPHIDHHIYCDTMFSIYIKKYTTLQHRSELVKKLFVEDEEGEEGEEAEEDEEIIHVKVKGRKYNITDFRRKHPGGDQLMCVKHGDDITKKFMQVHGNDFNSPEKNKLKKVLNSLIED